MLQALRERRQDDRGFTLIELMIVVLIIGILIAVGLPSFLGARNRAQDRAAQAVLRNAVVAGKTWYTDLSTYASFNSAATAGAKGCPNPLPAVPTGGDSPLLQAGCVEPSIPWVTAARITTSTSTGIVDIKLASATELCLVTVSANGPTLWYAYDSGSGTVVGLAAAANSIPIGCDGVA